MNRRERVLIVENDELTALSLASVLELIGLEVIGVTDSVRGALAVVQDSPPELAILGVRLSGKRDGIEGAGLLRDLLGIPVVILTGQDDHESGTRAGGARLTAVLQKPVPLNILVSAVQNAIQNWRMETLAPDLNRRTPSEVQ